jgi:hypothetical protein
VQSLSRSSCSFACKQSGVQSDLKMGVPVSSRLLLRFVCVAVAVLAVSAEDSSCSKGDTPCFCKSIGGTWRALQAPLLPACKVTYQHQGTLEAIQFEQLQKSLEAQAAGVPFNCPSVTRSEFTHAARMSLLKVFRAVYIVLFGAARSHVCKQQRFLESQLSCCCSTAVCSAHTLQHLLARCELKLQPTPFFRPLKRGLSSQMQCN